MPPDLRSVQLSKDPSWCPMASLLHMAVLITVSSVMPQDRRREQATG